MRIRHSEKVEQLYQVLLDNASSHTERDYCLNQLGFVYDGTDEYLKVLSYYERSLEIYKVALPLNHPNFATSYNNIGLVYMNMGEYSKTLSFFEKAHNIWVQVLHPTHPHIGMVKNFIEQVKKMLSK